MIHSEEDVYREQQLELVEQDITGTMIMLFVCVEEF
jgi:hypothetical protein